MAIVLMNHGEATHTLQPHRAPDGKDKDGKDKFKETPRLLKPGESIEALDDAEAERMLQYKDIKDAAKVVPTNAVKIGDQQAEINRLRSEIEELKYELEGQKGEAQDGSKAKKK